MNKKKYLDSDERKLAQSLENEEWISDLTQKDKTRYREYARYSLNKQKRINIRMSERDLKKSGQRQLKKAFPIRTYWATNKEKNIDSV